MIRLIGLAMVVAALALTPSGVGEPKTAFYYARVADDGQYHVKATVNRRSTMMLVDTGASDVLVGENVAQALGLPKGGRAAYYLMADGGLSSCRRVNVDQLQIGSMSRNKVNVSVCKIGSPSLLGISVIRTFHVTVDKDGILFEDK